MKTKIECLSEVLLLQVSSAKLTMTQTVIGSSNVTQVLGNYFGGAFVRGNNNTLYSANLSNIGPYKYL